MLLHHELNHHRGHPPIVVLVKLTDLDDQLEYLLNELTRKPMKKIALDAFPT